MSWSYRVASLSSPPQKDPQRSFCDRTALGAMQGASLCACHLTEATLCCGFYVNDLHILLVLWNKSSSSIFLKNTREKVDNERWPAAHFLYFFPFYMRFRREVIWLHWKCCVYPLANSSKSGTTPHSFLFPLQCLV